MEPTVAVRIGQGTGSDTYFRLGFCPAYVKVMGAVEEDITEWCLGLMPGNDSIETIDSTGVRTLDASDGIDLVAFDDGLGAIPGAGGAPSAVGQDEFYKANGICIGDACAPIADGNPYMVLAVRAEFPIIRAVHDGGDNKNTYFQDSSIDFKDAGVSGGQTFIIINESNDNYGYVKAVQKPSGQSKYCRLTVAENAAGDAAAAADFDDDDVCYIIPAQFAQYPLSGIGALT